MDLENEVGRTALMETGNIFAGILAIVTLSRVFRGFEGDISPPPPENGLAPLSFSQYLFCVF